MLYHVSINFVSFASRILESAVLGWCKDRHCNYVWHRSVPWKKLKTAAGPWARPHMWQSLSIFYNSRKYSGQAFSGNLLLGNTIAIIITVHVPGPHTWPRPGPSQAPRPNSKTQLQLPFLVGSVPTPIGRGEAKIFSTLLQSNSFLLLTGSQRPARPQWLQHLKKQSPGQVRITLDMQV